MITERQKKLLDVLRTGVVIDKEFAVEVLDYSGDKHADILNCADLYKDIIEINNDSEIEEIIVVNRNKIKLATEEEAEQYLEKLMKKALKSFSRYWSVCRKLKKNDQFDLFKDDFIKSVEKSC